MTRSRCRSCSSQGLICSARLYASQIPALWRFGPVMIADHRRDDSMEAIAGRILAAAPPRFALAGLSMGGYIALDDHAAGAGAGGAGSRLLDTTARPDTPGADRAPRWRQIALARTRAVSARSRRRCFRFSCIADRHGDADAASAIVQVMARGDRRRRPSCASRRAIMARPDARPLLPRSSCPTLVLVGRGRRAHAAGVVAGNRRRHCRRAARDGARLRASLDAGAAGCGERGAGGMDGGMRPCGAAHGAIVRP